MTTKAVGQTIDEDQTTCRISSCRERCDWLDFSAQVESATRSDDVDQFIPSVETFENRKAYCTGMGCEVLHRTII